MSTPQKGFGRAKTGGMGGDHAQARAADEPGLDFNTLRGDDAAQNPATARVMIYILLAIMLGLLLGGFYFIHVMLAFKSGMESNTTAIYGPYPAFAVSFAIIPACCGIFYFLQDFFRLKTGINPFTSPRGIAASLAAILALLMLNDALVALIRHNGYEFAAAHGYVRCASPFDPHQHHIFALKSYVEAYGCPTVNLPQ